MARPMRLRVLAVCSAVLALGCPKKEQPAAEAKPAPTPTPAAAVKAAPPAQAECEFTGSWSPGTTKAARYAFVAQGGPCRTGAAGAQLGSMSLAEPGSFFAEFFVPQGSTGHLCVFGYDPSGAIVAVGEPAGNPVRFEGEGEVMFTNLTVTVAALDPAAQPAVPAKP